MEVNQIVENFLPSLIFFSADLSLPSTLNLSLNSLHSNHFYHLYHLRGVVFHNDCIKLKYTLHRYSLYELGLKNHNILQSGTMISFYEQTHTLFCILPRNLSLGIFLSINCKRRCSS